MSTPILFNGGVPTGPDVDKLFDKIGIPAVGTVIPYASVSAVIGCERDSSRFQSVVKAWRKRLFNAHNLILDTVANTGFVVLGNSQRVAFSANRFKQGLRRIRRSASIAAKTDSAGLAPEEVRARDHIVGVGAKLQLVAATEARTARLTR
jgi:hypothetical protein